MIYRFGDALRVIGTNDFVALDTSLVYQFWGQAYPHPRTHECQMFIQDVARNGAIMVVPIQVLIELRLLVTDDIVGPKSARKPILGQASLMKQVVQRVAQLEQAIFSHAGMYPDPIGIIDSATLTRVDEIMAQAQAQYGDAVIASILERNGIGHIATLDQDFCTMGQHLQSISVFTDKKTYKTVTTGTSATAVP